MSVLAELLEAVNAPESAFRIYDNESLSLPLPRDEGGDRAVVLFTYTVQFALPRSKCSPERVFYIDPRAPEDFEQAAWAPQPDLRGFSLAGAAGCGDGTDPVAARARMIGIIDRYLDGQASDGELAEFGGLFMRFTPADLQPVYFQLAPGFFSAVEKALG